MCVPYADKRRQRCHTIHGLILLDLLTGMVVFSSISTVPLVGVSDSLCSFFTAGSSGTSTFTLRFFGVLSARSEKARRSAVNKTFR